MLVMPALVSTTAGASLTASTVRVRTLSTSAVAVRHP